LNPQNGSLKQKTSFYYPFLLLSPDKRRALETLYRFCWAADDISDSTDPLPLKKKKLEKFKKDLKNCFSKKNQEPFFKGLQAVINEFHLTQKPFGLILQGVEQDLSPIRFNRFSQLHAYALKVAGGPGLSSMEIFGFRDKAHRGYAENLGVFLQLVNIVRDYKEDLGLDRQYLPGEDFKRFHLDPAHVVEGDSHWKPFVEFQLDRAWSFLEKSRASLTPGQRGRLPTAEAIAAVYVKLFQKLKERPHLILKEKVTLSQADKLFSAMGAAGRCFITRWTGH
jgi:phytoene synthase